MSRLISARRAWLVAATLFTASAIAAEPQFQIAQQAVIIDSSSEAVIGQFHLTITNAGDTTALDVQVGLPAGEVNFVGDMVAGETRTVSTAPMAFDGLGGAMTWDVNYGTEVGTTATISITGVE